jgi:peptidoglycan/xylan/chitin deacetylase (PgdA/CDA1 family)/glycosyltransferase involved in cell wall biosynthesis
LRILHVLSQIELTGAEVYAITLAEWQRSQGHQVFLVSDTINSKTTIPFTALAIHHSRPLSRAKSIRALRKILITEKIDVIHAHSRAAVRVASKARRGLLCAMVSTVHGRQHSSFSKKLFDIYGEKVIAVCENIAEHLKQDFKMSPRKIHVLGNPMKIEKFKPRPADFKAQTILLMGRTSGPKGEKTGELIKKVFPSLLQEFSGLNIRLIGGNLSELKEDVQQQFQSLQQKFPGRLSHENFVQEADEAICQSSLVIGAGRVALSAALQGRPTFCLGEHQSHGLLTLKNLNECRASNFGDIGFGETQPIDFEQALSQIRSVCLSESVELESQQGQISENLHELYDLEKSGLRILNIYKAAHFQRHVPKWFPIMMYHKVVDQTLETKHRIFVTKKTFQKHLQFYKWRGFETINFADLSDFWNFRRPMSEFPRKPLMITFDDGYLNNLQNAVPLLQGFGFKSTVFLLASTKVKSNAWDAADGTPQLPLMNSIERLQLKKTGQEVGSHGFSHEKLTSMNETQTKDEVQNSKLALEKEFGAPVFVYAYTYGLKNEFSEKSVADSGYDFAVNTTTGGLHIADNPFSLFRVSIFPEDGYFDIFKKSSSWYRQYYFNKRGE